MRKRSIGFALAAALCAAPGVVGQDMLLVGGRVVDPVAREVRTENLLIRDGVIVAAVETAPAGFAGETLDVSGRWVIPAFVDLHTHSFGNQTPVQNAGEFLMTPGTAKRMLYAGVGAFLDLFSLEDAIFGLRNNQRENGLEGADIFAAGPCITTPEGHCSEYGIPTRLASTPAEARAQVSDLASKRPDVIKIVYSQHGRMPSVDRATMTAAVEEANRLGITTVVHVDSWDDVRHAAEAGATAVTHVPETEPIPDDALALMVEHGVTSIPTLAVQLGVLDLSTNPHWLDSPLARGVTTDAVRGAYSREDWGGAALRWRENMIQRRATILENVRKMHEAGVPVLTGTDSGNLGTIQGWSMHHELMKLVEAGLDEWEALAAGSVRAAAFLGQTYGVTEGATANLVVLEASPVDDIRNTQRIVDVIQRGARVDRAALGVR